MDAQTLAELLNGSEYPLDVDAHLVGQAEEHRLVIVSGYSDDGLMFEGAIDEHLGAYDGTTALVVGGSAVDEDRWDEDKQVFARYGLKIPRPIKVIAKWAPKEPDASWLITVEGVESFPFDVMEDGELFCRGAVFKLPQGTQAVAVNWGEQ